jgi:predicted nuclease of restriction endonuclease-like (RecB) superfamily
LSWWHQIALLEKLNDREIRLWYASKAAEHGWTRDVLVHQIEGALHLREGKGLTNFDETLPSPQSKIAQQITKNPYIFGFLGLDEQATEREVEHGLMAHVERFLLELGEGFAVVGRQRHLEVGGQDFYIDLLLYLEWHQFEGLVMALVAWTRKDASDATNESAVSAGVSPRGCAVGPRWAEREGRCGEPWLQ